MYVWYSLLVFKEGRVTYLSWSWPAWTPTANAVKSLLMSKFPVSWKALMREALPLPLDAEAKAFEGNGC
jgi:hypothetical protein